MMLCKWFPRKLTSFALFLDLRIRIDVAGAGDRAQQLRDLDAAGACGPRLLRALRTERACRDRLLRSTRTSFGFNLILDHDHPFPVQILTIGSQLRDLMRNHCGY